jgi:hypothetical protein
MLVAAWVTAIATSVLALGVPIALATWLYTRRRDLQWAEDKREQQRRERDQEQRALEERLEERVNKAVELLGSRKARCADRWHLCPRPGSRSPGDWRLRGIRGGCREGLAGRPRTKDTDAGDQFPQKHQSTGRL